MRFILGSDYLRRLPDTAVVASWTVLQASAIVWQAWRCAHTSCQSDQSGTKSFTRHVMVCVVGFLCRLRAPHTCTEYFGFPQAVLWS